jgi:antitoxin HigA-1
MDPRVKYIKGIHPGLFLERILEQKGLEIEPFAHFIGEDLQSLIPVIKAERNMNISLALKIEKALGLEEGTLMILQIFHDIKEEKRKLTKHIKPDLSKLRAGLFWDTKLENIDWIANKKFVIDRVNERGSDEEKELIAMFYASI